MHEIAIVKNTFDIILEVAKNEKLGKITRVNFQIGEMHGIVPGIFRFAFESASENTIAENAELNLEIVPVKMKCNSCAKEIKVTHGDFSCSHCGATDLAIVNGKELTIKSIEGE